MSQLSRGRSGKVSSLLGERMERDLSCALCLGWDRPTEEGHGHEMLAQCPAVGQDLLWLELTATREILNGNQLFERPPPEGRAQREQGERHRVLLCRLLLLPWKTAWGIPGAASWCRTAEGTCRKDR